MPLTRAAVWLSSAALVTLACCGSKDSARPAGRAAAAGSGGAAAAGKAGQAGVAGTTSAGAGGSDAWQAWPGSPAECAILYHSAPSELAGWAWSTCDDLAPGCRKLVVPAEVVGTFIRDPSVRRRPDGKLYVALDRQTTVEPNVSGYWDNVVQADEVNVAAWRVHTSSQCNFQASVADAGIWIAPYRSKLPTTPVAVLAQAAPTAEVLRTELFSGTKFLPGQRATQLGDWLVVEKDYGQFAAQRLDTSVLLQPKAPGFDFQEGPYLFADGFLFGASTEGAGSIFRVSFDGTVAPVSGVPSHARSVVSSGSFVFYVAPGKPAGGIDVYESIELRVAPAGTTIPDLSKPTVLSILKNQGPPPGRGGDGWFLYRDQGPPIVTRLVHGSGKRKHLPEHPVPNIVGGWAPEVGTIVEGRLWLPAAIPNTSGGYREVYSFPVDALPDD